ncbi:MAG TPA: riboflavin synthase [Longimicrobiales bacterium]|nr:riboflavin synthase [Longimicrobiales bacterium]
MFSGIVEEVGRITGVRPLGGGRRIELAASAVLADLRPGDSVAVDGVCLTATDVTTRGFGVDATATTLSRTTLGEVAEGRAVNLERAMAAGDRFGGHIVQGHVDGVGTVVAIEEDGEQHLVDVALPEEVARATVERGSLAIDGVSMTVAEMPSPTVARLAVIPYTWTHTNFARLRPGSAVNLEADLIGRYVAKHLESMGEALRREPPRS